MSGFWISCTYWTLKGFWISCIYWTGTRDFCTRQIFKEFLDFLTGTRVFCICWTFKGTPDFLYKLNF
ncbi:hypothetical protein RhiirA1_474435 [Rhizophagus irregularis]|uniref:Uncharacterized protein n=1 Tax=Rhizophagus irregularis TaxID=588596 RepID=A0A2N0QYN7_9GLOM|nr:hypothetical protein RhiirA1_474435 [Rhizophagus irregularis]